MTDNINNPAHYTAYPVEVIELTEHLNFCRGNVVKYVARAGLKDAGTEVEDLRKAQWYLEREIKRLELGEVEQPAAQIDAPAIIATDTYYKRHVFIPAEAAGHWRSSVTGLDWHQDELRDITPLIEENEAWDGAVSIAEQAAAATLNLPATLAALRACRPTMKGRDA